MTKLTILGVEIPVSDKVIYATEEASREYINAMKKGMTQEWKEFRARHPEHLGEAGGYCVTCALIDALKEERNRAYEEGKAYYHAENVKFENDIRNAVLEEVEREVEKKQAPYKKDNPKAPVYFDYDDISTIINNLKVK